MIKFLLIGLLRDRSRSLLPIVVVTLGVMITVFLQAYMGGVLGDSIESTARFTTGHVKVATRGYHDNASQIPNDYAIVGATSIQKSLYEKFPDMTWVSRIHFAGLLDAPDAEGQTRSQGNIVGMAVDLLESGDEIQRMDIRAKLVKGHFPVVSGEIMLSDELFNKMGLQLGEVVTLMSTGMYGDMAMYNFTVAGTLHFGISMLDKGMMIADLSDIRIALDMDDASGEILGFFNGKFYDDSFAKNCANSFNQKYSDVTDLYLPHMLPLSEQTGMGFFVNYAKYMQSVIILIFVFAMSIVLWNAGLLGGLRRYGEFGLRMAIGESKNEIYKTLIGEAVLVGLMGSVIGTALGVLAAWPMQKYGVDIGEMMKDATMMMSTVLRARITPQTYFIGFVPGLLSTVIGSMLAGIGIYKRQTAHLFKELEA